MEQIILSITILAVIALVFILGRELLCWYWKINQHINNQAKQIELLENAIQQITETKDEISASYKILKEELKNSTTNQLNHEHQTKLHLSSGQGERQT